MANALGIIAVVLGVSVLEGLWGWLLVAALSEVAGQVYPPLLLLTLVLFAAWLASRLLALSGVALDRRRWVLAAAGLGLGLAAATIHSGLIHPLQLVFGRYTPDLRGAGVSLVLVMAYLWGRGLAAAGPMRRERVLNHVGVSGAGAALVLVFLPLTDTVRELGLTVVLASFLVGVASLLLVQLAGVESRQLSRLQWAGVGAGSTILLVVFAAIVTGALTSGGIGVVGQGLAIVGRIASPVTNVVLIAAGYLAQYLYYLFQWLAQIFGGDPEAIQRTVEQAERQRPRIVDEPGTAPEVLGGIVAVFLTFLFITAVISIYYRLIRRAAADNDRDVLELRARIGGPSLGGLLRGVVDQLRRGRGDADDDADPRTAIRRHYRAFQTLMVRAGLPRQPSQTPSEYEAAVREALPPAADATEVLTQAYLVARYADAQAVLPAPQSAGQAVLRIREALRRRDEAAAS